MELLRKIEDVGVELFARRMPLQLQPAMRKRLADLLWVIVLLVGIGQLLAVFLLWQAGQRVNELIDTANYLSRLYGDSTVVDHPGFFFYLTVVLMLVEACLLLWAVPALRALRKARGWNYAFYALLLSLLTGLLRVFSDVNGGIGNLLLAVLGAGIGGYILFQVRQYFNGYHDVKQAALEKKAENAAVAAAARKDDKHRDR